MFKSKLKWLTESNHAASQRPEGFTIDLSEEDVDPNAPTPFLGTYSYEEVLKDFKEYKILDGLKELGFDDVEILVDTSDYFVHSIKVTTKALKGKPDQDNFLILFFLRRKSYQYVDLKQHKQHYSPQTIEYMESQLSNPMQATVIEYLTLQDPTKEFEKNRPQLYVFFFFV